jgi:hypothetical protein
MDIQKYIMDQALILIPVLYVLGYLIKQSAINDKFIPCILLIVSVLLSIALLGVSVQSVIQGILVCGATILTNQVVKQIDK